ncbi:hypothetical protein M493_02195 [Geobacillus genomosp. 3]|uniref:Uncharacterized protein n=1 Tax=Geobacillus genomosp. 3 TaxID=1921421 RepID=S5ZKC5_GEOG3|nr:hypothetical protein M493_02195 [Geobacillus genomosp. 3]
MRAARRNPVFRLPESEGASVSFKKAGRRRAPGLHMMPPISY